MTPPRPPPLPDRPPALDQQPERQAVRMPRDDPPLRTATLPGMPSVAIPRAELAPTLPAPARKVPSPWGQTAMRPAPPSTVALARRSEPPTGAESSATSGAATGQPDASLPPPSLNPEQATIHALRVELEAYRTGKKRPPESAPPDRGAWAKLGYRVAAAAAGAAVLVIAALGARAVSMIETKADATKAAQKQTTETVNARDVEWQTWARRVVAIEECRREQQSQAFERLLPSKERLGAARPMAPWVDECPSLPKPP